MYNILFTNNFLQYMLKEKYIKYVKYLNMNNDNIGELLDISSFINLEYLSISIGFIYSSNKYDKLILRLSLIQIKNIKTIKVHESREINNTLTDIIIQ